MRRVAGPIPALGSIDSPAFFHQSTFALSAISPKLGTFGYKTSATFSTARRYQSGMARMYVLSVASSIPTGKRPVSAVWTECW
jgi:hypothetical protein